MNLGLPVAPSFSSPTMQYTNKNESGGFRQGFDPTTAPLNEQQYTGASALVPEGKTSGLLFPLETRAHGLDGKLVQQALTKTLTAGDLARHLESSNIFAKPGDVNIGPIRADALADPTTPRQARTADDHGALRPPPGLAMTHDAQMDMNIYSLQGLNLGDQQPSTPPSRPRAMREASGSYLYHQGSFGSPMDHYGALYASPPANPTQLLQYAPPPSYNQSHSGSKYASRGRRASGRGRSVLKPYVLKPKRADQGPMPSSADIYPEDAVSPNANALYEEQHPAGYLRNPRMSQPPPPLPSLRVEDANAWPTPAEAKTTKPAVRTSSLSTSVVQPSDKPAEEQHPENVQPTESATISEDNVPTVSEDDVPTSKASPTDSILSNYSLKLIADSRPLTPHQLDGSRYGLRFFGLGLNDAWIPPPIKGLGPQNDDTDEEVPWPKKQFRTRPRLHEGWGGWEWAHKEGWYDDDE